MPTRTTTQRRITFYPALRAVLLFYVLPLLILIAALSLPANAAHAETTPEPSVSTEATPGPSEDADTPAGKSDRIDPNIRYGNGEVQEEPEEPAKTQEPKKPAEPIKLPEVQNLETLWLIPIVVVVLLGLYFLVTRVSSDTKKRRKQLRAEAARQERLDAIWTKITDRHDELKGLYLKAETDWDMLFSMPALQDVSIPETAAMIQTMNAADNARCPRPRDLTEDQDIHKLSYPRAVQDFSNAWQAAMDKARSVGQKMLPREERKLLREIRQLLTLAENAGASDSERQLAYQRARSAMDKLSDTRLNRRISALAINQIEATSRLAIDSGQKLHQL